MSRIHSAMPTVTLTNGSTANSGSFYPQPGHKRVVAFVKLTTSSADVALQRLDVAGNWNNLETAVSQTSGTEVKHLIDFPVAGPVRVRFTNIVTTGSAQVEFMDDAP